MGDLTPRTPDHHDLDLRGARKALLPEERPDVDTPAQSLAEAAQRYAIARRRWDESMDGNEPLDPGLLGAALAHADELARRVVANPTSRIRPAFDRRYVTVDRRRVHPKDLQTAIRPAELVGSAVDPWSIAQALFEAKMDFLRWRTGEGLTAVGDVSVEVNYSLRVPVVPDNMTDREMAGLPRDIIGIEVHPEEKAAYETRSMKAWVERA